jgi:hypothetical protein
MFIFIFMNHFLFELAGVDDDGAGSVAVVEKYQGTLKDGLRGFFALGGGGPGLPIFLSWKYLNCLKENVLQVFHGRYPDLFPNKLSKWAFAKASSAGVVWR